MTYHTIAADGISVTLDLSVGHIAALQIRDGDRILEPLHRAPWADDDATQFPADTAPNVRRLSGDFFCAPFGRNDVEEGPSHGWPANSGWDHVGTMDREGRITARFRLRKPVMGASVEKSLGLVDGHPFLYQEHCFIGGSGAVSAAHHVMVRMAAGGELAFSPKAYAETPPEALEPDPARGRSILAYPARTCDLSAFPLADGGFVDLKRYPPGQRHEDFLTMVEDKASAAAGPGLGWSAVRRIAEADRVLVLKWPDCLPATMVWMSNGGRDYAPWSGRHLGVFGIEDARASPLGHRASCDDNAFKQSGIPTAFDLAPDRRVSIRQVIGACAASSAERALIDIGAEQESLILRFQGGQSRALRYNPGFLAEKPVDN